MKKAKNNKGKDLKTVKQQFLDSMRTIEKEMAESSEAFERETRAIINEELRQIRQLKLMGKDTLEGEKLLECYDEIKKYEDNIMKLLESN